MVGPLILLKLLHSKRSRQGNTSSATESATTNSTRVKMEPKNDDDYTCRICLKDGGIPIFDDESQKDLSEDLNSFANIEVRMDDDYPKYLCSSCHSLLQGAILFRKTAQKTEKTLRKSSGNCLTYENMSDDNGDYVEEKVKLPPDFHCQRCDLDFDTFEEYDDHRASAEHENMKIKCPVCNNCYSETYLKKHLLLHQSDVPYVCDICGKKFVIQGQFARHRLTHFYSLPFKCSLCPYRGRFTESLKMHMRTHTGDKPYQCSVCAKCFISKSNLNKHMYVHRADRDYKCETCDRGFNSKRNMELHFKVDHSGLKEHICNICGKAFGYRKQMMKHQLKVHKREKLRSGRLPLYLQVESKQRDGEEVPISDTVILNRTT